MEPQVRSEFRMKRGGEQIVLLHADRVVFISKDFSHRRIYGDDSRRADEHAVHSILTLTGRRICREPRITNGYLRLEARDLTSVRVPSHCHGDTADPRLVGRFYGVGEEDGAGACPKDRETAGNAATKRFHEAEPLEQLAYGRALATGNNESGARTEVGHGAHLYRFNIELSEVFEMTRKITLEGDNANAHGCYQPRPAIRSPSSMPETLIPTIASPSPAEISASVWASR